MGSRALLCGERSVECGPLAFNARLHHDRSAEEEAARGEFSFSARPLYDDTQDIRTTYSHAHRGKGVRKRRHRAYPALTHGTQRLLVMRHDSR